MVDIFHSSSKNTTPLSTPPAGCPSLSVDDSIENRVLTQAEKTASRLPAVRTLQWAKKIRGKLQYFGPWANPDAALEEYVRVKDDLYAGRTPPLCRGAITLADVCNGFLERSERRAAAGDISPRTFTDYVGSSKVVVAHFGRTADPEQLRPADFAGFRHSLSPYSPARIAKLITVTRMILRWAYESELIDRLPQFGPDFKPQSKRREREAAGQKMFEREQILTLLNHASVNMRAMILLGVNCGYGNTDVAKLPLAAVSSGSGWIEFPRPKTGVNSRAPLWAETSEAIAGVIRQRPETTSRELFVTSRGHPLVPANGHCTCVTNDFRRLRNACGLSQGGFYWLRHVTQTIGDEAGDPLATSHIMGHADSSMSGVYRERISDKRLRRVADHVHRWLFANVDTQATEASGLRAVGKR